MDLTQLLSRHEGHDHADMAGMDMGTSANASSADPGMGMDMGMGMSSCKISMLWNWNTVDSCFLAESWHVKTKGAFAGSVIGVFILVILIEALRRGAREYDRYLVRSAMVSAGYSIDGGNGSGSGLVRNGSGDDTKVLGNVEGQIKPPFEFTPSWVQQLLRAFAYGTQFTASFLVMLLGMYYNGYILFAIFIGHTVGYFAFARDTGTSTAYTGSGHCC